VEETTMKETTNGVKPPKAGVWTTGDPIGEPTDGEWRYEYRGPWQQHIVTNLPGMGHNILIADLGTQKEVDANGYLLAAAKKLKAALLRANKVIRDLNRGGRVVNESITHEITEALRASIGPRHSWLANPDRRPPEKPAKAPDFQQPSLDELLAGMNPLETWICEKRGRQMRVWHFQDIKGLSMTGHPIIWRVDLEESDVGVGVCSQSFSDVTFRASKRVTTYSANGKTLPEAIVAALKAAEKGDAIPL
jgi:hypothetical protein